MSVKRVITKFAARQTLLLRELHQHDDGHVGMDEVGRMTWDGTSLSFDGIGKKFYDMIREDYPDAPENIPDLFKWADKEFDGTYFFAELQTERSTMTKYSSADQLLRPGEVGLFIFTGGKKLTINPDGSGSTGNWDINPLRRVDWVFIYKRDSDSTSRNELWMARSGDLKRKSDRFLINLREIKRVGYTDMNWPDFVGARGRQELRYIERS